MFCVKIGAIFDYIENNRSRKKNYFKRFTIYCVI